MLEGDTPGEDESYAEYLGVEGKQKSKDGADDKRPWHCLACSYLNVNPLHLSCAICGTPRGQKVMGDDGDLGESGIGEGGSDQGGSFQGPRADDDAKIASKQPEVIEDDDVPEVPVSQIAAAAEEIEEATKIAKKKPEQIEDDETPQMAAAIEGVDVSAKNMKKKTELIDDENAIQEVLDLPDSGYAKKPALASLSAANQGEPATTALLSPSAQQQTTVLPTRPPPPSMLRQESDPTVPSTPILEARLVQDEPSLPYAEAIPLQSFQDNNVQRSWCREHQRFIIVMLLFVIVALTVTLGLSLSFRGGEEQTTPDDATNLDLGETLSPQKGPTLPPTQPENKPPPSLSPVPVEQKPTTNPTVQTECRLDDSDDTYKPVCPGIDTYCNGGSDCDIPRLERCLCNAGVRICAGDNVCSQPTASPTPTPPAPAPSPNVPAPISPTPISPALVTTPAPTEKPTKNPTNNPTKNPTRKPTAQPTFRPTNRPTRRPTRIPTRRPTRIPTKMPTAMSLSLCTDTPNWVDSYGDVCSWYEANDRPGCPNHGISFIGSMGSARDNCCYCSNQGFSMSLPHSMSLRSLRATIKRPTNQNSRHDYYESAVEASPKATSKRPTNRNKRHNKRRLAYGDDNERKTNDHSISTFSTSTERQTTLATYFYADLKNNRCIRGLSAQPSARLRRFEKLEWCCKREFGPYLQDDECRSNSRKITMNNQTAASSGGTLTAVPFLGKAIQACEAANNRYGEYPSVYKQIVMARHTQWEHQMELIQMKMLNDKLGAYTYASGLGVRTPRVLFCGVAEDLPTDMSSFGDNFVVKPIVGHSSEGVRVVKDSADLLKHKNFTHASLVETYGMDREVIVEELIESDHPEYEDLVPPDYKFFVFDGVIELLAYVDRNKAQKCCEFFDVTTDTWRHLPDFSAHTAEYAHCTQAQLRLEPSKKSALKKAVQTLANGMDEDWIRIDMYHGKNGPVLGEFTPFSANGKATPLVGCTLSYLFVAHSERRGGSIIDDAFIRDYRNDFTKLKNRLMLTQNRPTNNFLDARYERRDFFTKDAMKWIGYDELTKCKRVMEVQERMDEEP